MQVRNEETGKLHRFDRVSTENLTLLYEGIYAGIRLAQKYREVIEETEFEIYMKDMQKGIRAASHLLALHYEID